MKDANEHEIRAWLAEREPAMLALLAELVNIDSGSYDKPGVDAVGARLAQFFESAGIAVRTEPVAERGDVMRMATVPDPAGPDHAAPAFLLMGHRDTVFPKGEPERRPFRVEGGRVVYGGPDEWSYRRFILHYAHLCAAAGGIDAFLIALTLAESDTQSVISTHIFGALVIQLRIELGDMPGSAVDPRFSLSRYMSQAESDPYYQILKKAFTFTEARDGTIEAKYIPLELAAAVRERYPSYRVKDIDGLERVAKQTISISADRPYPHVTQIRLRRALSALGVRT